MRTAQRLLRGICPKIYRNNSYSVCRVQEERFRNLCLGSKKNGNTLLVPTICHPLSRAITYNAAMSRNLTCRQLDLMSWTRRNNIECSSVRNMAGHSHWKNIKHIKEAKDAAKSELSNHQLKIMGQIIKEGGADPQKNVKLAAHVDRVIKLGVPKATVQKFIERYEKHADQMETFYLEVRGPAGTVIVAEVQSPQALKTKQEMNSVLKKTGGQIQKHVTWPHLFEQKGVIIVPMPANMLPNDNEHFLEIAIETGAEDVIVMKNDNSEIEAENVLKFHCNPKNLATVAKAIEEMYDLEVVTREIDLTPHMWVTVDNEEDIELCRKIISKLEAHPEVTNVFDNISVPED